MTTRVDGLTEYGTAMQKCPFMDQIVCVSVISLNANSL